MERHALVGSGAGGLVGPSLSSREDPRGASSLPTRTCRPHERRQNSARLRVELNGASWRRHPESNFAFFSPFLSLVPRVLTWL